MGLSAIAAFVLFSSAAGGFFRPEKVGGVWHLARQGEEPVRILSTSHVGFGGTADASGKRPQEARNKAKYASREKWAETTLSRLREWGFNTVGNPVREFKGREMPYFRYIQFTPRFMLEDVKDEEWVKSCIEHFLRSEALISPAETVISPITRPPTMLTA